MNELVSAIPLESLMIDALEKRFRDGCVVFTRTHRCELYARDHTEVASGISLRDMLTRLVRIDNPDLFEVD